ncbi:uncharacterized protein LOC142582217 [Dermacentor variabilis]|uniref:uncharacterized protein LOC142582217 n=1 Tax=Dermacentor variabilis TaxID=34621 RepID=UPI003F5C2EAA
MSKRPIYWVRCCVPGCNKGALQREQGRPLSVFRAPRDDAAREVWEQRLELAPGSLRPDSQLCELHFDPGQICRDYVHLIGGKEVRIPRGRAALLPDAVPLAPRKHPHCEEFPDPKRVRLGDDPNPMDEDVDKLLALRLPSKYWSCLRCHNLEGAVFVTSSFNPATADLVTEKMVVVQWAAGEKQEAVVCETLVRGRRLGDVVVGDLCAVQHALCEVDALHLCAGVGSVEYVLEQLGGRLTAHLERSLAVHGGTYFSSACVATVEAVAASCGPCKLARKAVLTKKSALLRKNFLVSYVDSSVDTK